MTTQSNSTFGMIWPALITSIASIIVAYIGFIKPNIDDEVKSSQDLYLEDLNTPVNILADNIVHQNKSKYRLFIYGYCNATVESKVYELHIGDRPDNLKLMSTGSGKDRGSISGVVPQNYFYKLVLIGTAGCRFTGNKI